MRISRTTLAIAAIAIIGASTLAACGSSDPNYKPSAPTGAPTPSVGTSFNSGWESVSAIVVKVNDKQYNCVTYRYDRGGGISCDWDHPIMK